MRRSFSVAVYGAKRTPIGSFQGRLSQIPACLLGAHALAAAQTQAQISSLDEVVFGTALPAGQGSNPARQAALAAGLPYTTVATTINKGESSGLKAVILAAETALLHPGRLLGAGGFENCSLVPHLLPQYRGGSPIGSVELLDSLMLDGLVCAQFNVPLGVVAEKTAVKFDFIREKQDVYAKETLINALSAWDRGFYQQEVQPLELLDQAGKKSMMTKDQHPFRINIEELRQLTSLYLANGSVTGGNSGTLADGAAALILGNSQNAAPPLAKLIGWAEASVEPEWFPLAIPEAVHKLLRSTDFPREKVDLFEVSDSVAIVALTAREKLLIHPERLNVNGGSVALGYPIGMTGARMLCSLIYALKERELRYGVVATCEGGGGATAVLVEVSR